MQRALLQEDAGVNQSTLPRDLKMLVWGKGLPAVTHRTQKLHFSHAGRAFVVWGAKNSVFLAQFWPSFSIRPRPSKSEAARCVLSSKAKK
jgi:hypothetical protein